jgi:hypothetical protein
MTVSPWATFERQTLQSGAASSTPLTSVAG